MSINPEGFFAYDGTISPKEYVDKLSKRYPPIGILSGDLWADVFILASNQFNRGAIDSNQLKKVIAFALDVETLLIPQLSDEELFQYFDGLWNSKTILQDLRKLSAPLSREQLLDFLQKGRREKLKERFGIDIEQT